MEKITKSIHSNFSYTHLYREDLENIENTLKEDLKSDEYSVSDQQYKYGNLGELLKKSKHHESLEFQTYNPYLSVELDKNRVRIYAERDSAELIGVVEKISSIIRTRERRVIIFLDKVHLVPTFLAGSLFVFAYIIYNSSLDNSPILIKFIFTTISILLLIWIAAIFFFRFNNIINFKYKNESPNFFEKNKDQLIIRLITIVFGVFIGALIQKLFSII